MQTMYQVSKILPIFDLHSNFLNLSAGGRPQRYKFATWTSAVSSVKRKSVRVRWVGCSVFHSEHGDVHTCSAQGSRTLLGNSSLAKWDIVLIFPDNEKLVTTPLNTSGRSIKAHGATTGNMSIGFSRSTMISLERHP